MPNSRTAGGQWPTGLYSIISGQLTIISVGAGFVKIVPAPQKISVNPPLPTGFITGNSPDIILPAAGVWGGVFDPPPFRLRHQICAIRFFLPQWPAFGTGVPPVPQLPSTRLDAAWLQLSIRATIWVVTPCSFPLLKDKSNVSESQLHLSGRCFCTANSAATLPKIQKWN